MGGKVISFQGRRWDMRIQTNTEALNTYRNISLNNRSLTQSLERLSSGFRINRAADDAAGLPISEKMRGQIRALHMSVRNALDGISLIQTAEGAMIEVHENLQRMRELSVQAASGSLTVGDRMNIQEEMEQMIDELNRITATTEFNTKKLLDGTTAALTSTSNSTTKVIVRDGLMVNDYFGQPAVAQGNYRLTIEAEAGVNQVQKSHIFASNLPGESRAKESTLLRNVAQFWDASGNFSLADPQRLSLQQGNGKRASITLYADDTLGDLRDKINQAIAYGLEQGDLVGEKNQDKFVSFIDPVDTPSIDISSEGLESTEGTLVVRSAIAGQEGEITFLAEDDILQGLGLMTIQEARSNVYTIDVKDAHTGEDISTGIRSNKSMLAGAVHQNVDILFDSQAGVHVRWNEKRLDWLLEGGEENRSIEMIHIAENTMMFHVGATTNKHVASAIADLGTVALGVDNLLVTSTEAANRSIAKIDHAIQVVSNERSKLGALQKRLEHTMLNLEVASENLSAAESRIRGVDMAREMMEFTKSQILAQSGTAMLAQANMNPQLILQVLV